MKPEQIMSTLLRDTFEELADTNKRIDEIKKQQEEDYRIDNLINEPDE